MKKSADSASSRSLKLGGYSVALTVIVLAILIVLNLVVRALPVTYTQYDTSAKKLFSLSDQTKELVSALNTDVELVHIVQGGTEDDLITGLLARYDALSDKLTVSTKDPVIYPTYLASYTDETVSNNSILVISGERSRYIPYTSIYVNDYSQYLYTGQVSSTFEFEGEVTSAIQYVATGQETDVYVLTGHGEADLPATIATTMDQQNMNVASLDLLSSGGVPKNADCIVIFSPQKDISDSERDMLLGFIDAGGTLLVSTDAGITDIPNLNEVLAEFGLSTTGGIIVEGDPNMALASYPYYLIPNLESHVITSPLKDNNYRILMPMAQPMTVSETDGVTVTELITTSESAYNKALAYESDTLEYVDGDEKGPFAVAAAAEKAVEGTTSKLVWFTSSMGFEDDVNLSFSGTNGDLFVNSMGWLTEQESAIAIHAKYLNEDSLAITALQAAVGKAVVVFIIPISFVIAGIIVWLRRRKK
ncbi:MAG: GldG family protein [Oscillospiraceae bacterium]|nr:GldG family protein [Oscillospiraceae bacterium]